MKKTVRAPVNPVWGYLFIVGAAVLWGVSGTAAKFLFHSGISPYELTQLRLTVTTTVLLAVILPTSPGLLKIAGKDLPYFAVFGTIGMGVCQFSYLFAISKIQVAAAILLQYLAPVFIALYAVSVAGERLDRPTVVSLAGAVAGCYLVVGAYRLELLTLNLSGVISGLVSAVAFAWYSIHGEYGMRRYGPWTVLFYAMLFAAVAWNILLPPLSAFNPGYDSVQWLWIGYIGIFGTLLPFGLYLQGINLIRAARASITATLEPITAGIAAWIFLGETMEPFQLLGAALVIGSIVFLQFNQTPDDRSPAAVRAAAEEATAMRRTRPGGSNERDNSNGP